MSPHFSILVIESRKYAFNSLKQAEGYYLVYGVLIGDIIHDTHHISLCGLKKVQLTNTLQQSEFQPFITTNSYLWHFHSFNLGFIELFKDVPALFKSWIYLIVISHKVYNDVLLLNGLCSLCSLVLYGVPTLMISSLRTSSLCSFSVGIKEQKPTWKRCHSDTHASFVT